MVIFFLLPAGVGEWFLSFLFLDRKVGPVAADSCNCFLVWNTEAVIIARVESSRSGDTTAVIITV